MRAAKSMAIASEAMEGVNKTLKNKLAQKAVHLNPSCREAWGALISSAEWNSVLVNEFDFEIKKVERFEGIE